MSNVGDDVNGLLLAASGHPVGVARARTSFIRARMADGYLMVSVMICEPVTT